MKELLYRLESMNEISGQHYFTCRLIESDSKNPEIKSLKSKTSALRWKVLGFSFLPAKEWKKGVRMIAVEPLQPDSRVSVGESLIGEL
jgi:hypothetical protein